MIALRYVLVQHRVDGEARKYAHVFDRARRRTLCGLRRDERAIVPWGTGHLCVTCERAAMALGLEFFSDSKEVSGEE